MAEEETYEAVYDEEWDASDGPVDGKKYAKWQMEKFADELLREDTRRELCRRCSGGGNLTGEIESLPQTDGDGNPQLDKEGNTLFVEYPELACEEGHRWYKGEGKARGIDGKNPILFKNHLDDRKRREIYTSVGTPDPSINRGMYNRTHPAGRKVNTKEQRKRNGASYYR